MIKAFIFDIGNVLLPFDFTIAVNKLSTKCKTLSESLVATCEPVKVAYESGQIGRDEFLKQIGGIIEYSGTDTEFVAAWEDIFTENVAMTALVRKLHGRYPLYLLSNTADIHLDYILRRYPHFASFTDGVYSYSAKFVKPHRAIYELAIRQFGVNPAETLFIDDLPQNIATARELGFQVFQYEYGKHEVLLEALRRARVEV